MKPGRNNKSKKKKFQDSNRSEQMIIDFSKYPSILDSKAIKNVEIKNKVGIVLKEKNYFLKYTLPKVEKLYKTNSRINKISMQKSVNTLKTTCVNLKKMLSEGKFNKFPEKEYLTYAVKILISEIVSLDKLFQLETSIAKEKKIIQDLGTTYDMERRIEPREAAETLESINYWKKELKNHSSLYKNSYPLIKNQYAKVLAMEKYITTLIEKAHKL